MIRKSLIAVAFLFLAVMPMSAQPKMGTVDIKKLFDGYWKTKQAYTNLNDKAAEFTKRHRAMLDDMRKLKEEYDKLVESAADQAVAVEERDKRKKSAEARMLELKSTEESVRNFDRMADTKLSEEERSLKDKLLGEIKDGINARAKAGGYSMILDIAIVPYTDGKTDITDEVLAQLNSTAPAVLTKPDDSKSEPKKDEKK